MTTGKQFGGKVTWLGHAAFLIESPKGARIAIDPFIGNNPKFPKGFDYGKLDAIAATHGHSDHFGADGVALAKKTDAMVVCIFERVQDGPGGAFVRDFGARRRAQPACGSVRVRPDVRGRVQDLPRR
jgi:glyoxylase-like metal-dependent hydrolase (beta-lactamase superfamily II)